MNYVNKDVLVAADESKSLEELACLRMRELANNGAGFCAFADIVSKVRNIHVLEHRVSVKRARVLAELANKSEDEY